MCIFLFQSPFPGSKTRCVSHRRFAQRFPNRADTPSDLSPNDTNDAVNTGAVFASEFVKCDEKMQINVPTGQQL